MKHRARLTPPHLEYYKSRAACPRHGTLNKLSVNGKCVTCDALASWRRRGDAASERAAAKAIIVAADRMQSILKRPQVPKGA
jgi:hypothetical protein